MTDAEKLLARPLGEILALLLAREPAAATWIDIRDPASPVPYRAALAAARRGELSVHRVGRRGLVRREELDAWIAAQPTLANVAVSDEPKTEPSAAEKILAREGWRRAG